MKQQHCTQSVSVAINGKTIGQMVDKCLINDDPTAHAVVECVRKLKLLRMKTQHLKDCQIYVESDICPMCATALRNYQIHHIILPDKQIADITKFYFQEIV